MIKEINITNTIQRHCEGDSPKQSRKTLCNSVSSRWFSVKQEKITQSCTEDTRRTTESLDCFATLKMTYNAL